jgi:hypothetical protein
MDGGKPLIFAGCRALLRGNQLGNQINDEWPSMPIRRFLSLFCGITGDR